jgi:hypothetical protein
LHGTVDQVAIWPRQQQGGQNKSYPVKIRLSANNEIAFHPGMSCRAEVIAKQGDGGRSVAVRVQSVKYEEAENKDAKAKTSVFVVVDGKAVKRAVETGAADDEYIEIVKGLKAEEEVVVGPSKTLNFLRDGERVAASPVQSKESQTADDKKEGGMTVAVN